MDAEGGCILAIIVVVVVMVLLAFFAPEAGCTAVLFILVCIGALYLGFGG